MKVNQDNSGKVLVVFLRDDDSIGVCYNAEKFEIETDGKFASALEVSQMSLGKFLPFPKLVDTLNEALVAVGRPAIYEDSKQTGAVSNNTESIFDFREITDGKPYPEHPNGSGFVTVHFPSHCRVCTPVAKTPSGAFAACEYGLVNDKGETVVQVKDTLGGFHPNFFNPQQREGHEQSYYKWFFDWVEKFVPFGSFANAQDRGNNHFDAYKKKILEGQYSFWYRNLSNTAHTVTAGFIRASNGVGAFNEIVQPYGSFSRLIDIRFNGDEYDDFKINTNNYTL